MKVFFHDDCLLHNPPYEILAGNQVPYFESPSRVLLIKETMDKYSDGQFDLCDELDFDLDVKKCCLRIHTADYLHYLETAYDDWVKAGGDKVQLPFYRCLSSSTVCFFRSLFYPTHSLVHLCSSTSPRIPVNFTQLLELVRINIDVSEYFTHLA